LGRRGGDGEGVLERMITREVGKMKRKNLELPEELRERVMRSRTAKALLEFLGYEIVSDEGRKVEEVRRILAERFGEDSEPTLIALHPERPMGWWAWRSPYEGGRIVIAAVTDKGVPIKAVSIPKEHIKRLAEILERWSEA